jgi:hypothetical protein
MLVYESICDQHRFNFWFSLKGTANSIGVSRLAPFKAERDYLSPELLSNSSETFAKDANRYRKYLIIRG